MRPAQLIWRPHVNGYKVTIDPAALRRTFVIDETVKYPIGLFVQSEPYEMWGLFTLRDQALRTAEARAIRCICWAPTALGATC